MSLGEPWETGTPHTVDAVDTVDELVRPVFVDHTGRRWRRLRIVGAALALLVAGGATFTWWQVDSEPRSVRVDPALTADLDPHAPTVVVGAGPMVRLLRLASDSGRTFGFDAVTGAPVGQLPGPDGPCRPARRSVAGHRGRRPRPRGVTGHSPPHLSDPPHAGRSTAGAPGAHARGTCRRSS